MRYIKNTNILFIIVTLLISNTISASNLQELYVLAKQNDPLIQAAQQTHFAAMQQCNIARGALLPTINATAHSTGNRHSSSTQPYHNYNSNAFAINLEQPIFRLTDWHRLYQANAATKQAHAVYASAEQDLILRLTTNYFAVQGATDALDAAQAKRKAFARSLEQARQRFKAGVIAITEVHEAQARYDGAKAQVITAANFLANNKEKLRVIVGSNTNKFAKLKTLLQLPTPKPNKIEHWVAATSKQNLAIQASQHAVQVAQQTMHANAAEHLPTLKLTSQITRDRGNDPLYAPGRTAKSIGLNLTMPLFAGGATYAKTRQARFNYVAAKHNYTQTYRTAESAARQAFNGVVTQISEVAARKQAVKSNRSALAAVKASYKAGIRTIVDVLNAQSNLIEAERQYYSARYGYILESLKLKQAAGILAPADIAQVNKMFAL